MYLGLICSSIFAAEQEFKNTTKQIMNSDVICNREKEFVPHMFDSDLPVALYQMVYDFQTVMEKYEVPFFFSSGTLLGAVRNGGMIPWDDDADCCVLEENKEIFIQKVVHVLQNLGYKVFYCSVGWTGYKVELWNEGKLITFLDVFFMRYDENKEEYVYPTGWPWMKLTKKQVYPLQKVVFGSINIYAPRDIDGFLTSNFGKNWQTHVVKHNHLFTARLTADDKKPRLAEPSDLLPAGPFGPLVTRDLSSQ